MNVSEFPNLMVAVAQQRSLPEVLRGIVSGIAASPSVALARIWLLQKGDSASSIEGGDAITDVGDWLQLAASAGNSTDANIDLTRVAGRHSRVPLGYGKIGAAHAGQPVLLRHLTGDEEWIADPAWVRGEEIRSFAGQPLVFGGDSLGVLAVFDRADLTESDFSWLRIFADHAAVTIANVNAFEEIAFLKDRLEEENLYLREEAQAARPASGLIGESAAVRAILQQIELVAETDATVLITGESGTGKELVARAIHERSQRRERPLIQVNCGAVPESLFESEFFGHVRGAFTGALRDKPGRFELADRGTLFLDEIGEIPLPMQAKLLRVLQEMEVERLGEARPRKVNVRIVAATNRDLGVEVAEGRFRRDLFYRLSVFPIHNPPLRDRPEDIRSLAEQFLRDAAKRLHRRRVPKLNAAALRELMAYDWPGNIRELQNTIERAVIMTATGPLRFDLGLSRNTAPASEQVSAGSPLLTREALKKSEREAISAALRQSGGRVAGPNGAAVLLRMKPTTLYSRISALKLKRNAEEGG